MKNALKPLHLRVHLVAHRVGFAIRTYSPDFWACAGLTPSAYLAQRGAYPNHVSLPG
jgi:hypothetical protein